MLQNKYQTEGYCTAVRLVSFFLIFITTDFFAWLRNFSLRIQMSVKRSILPVTEKSIILTVCCWGLSLRSTNAVGSEQAIDIFKIFQLQKMAEKFGKLVQKPPIWLAIKKISWYPICISIKLRANKHKRVIRWRCSSFSLWFLLYRVFVFFFFIW